MRYIIGVGLVLTLVSARINGNPDEDAAEKSLKPSDAPSIGVSSVWDDVPDDRGSRAADEVGESRGNWFFKSQILKKAINPVKEVQRIVKDIAPYQKIFADRHKAFKADLELFNQDYGFQDADVATQTGGITAELELNEQRLRQPVLPPAGKKAGSDVKKSSVNPSDEIKRLKVNQADIAKLAQKMAQLRKIEAAADESIKMITDVIKNAREFEAQAWRDHEKIADTLSDVVAESRYRAIEAAVTNANSVKQYCAETFEGFFSGLVQEASGLMQEIKSGIESLRARGYGFGKKAVTALTAEREAAAEAARLKAIKPIKKPEPVSWWVSIWNSLINAFRSAGKAIIGLFGRS